MSHAKPPFYGLKHTHTMHTRIGTAPAQTAMFEKGVKTKALLAVDHFNKDYKKGFQFLQVGCCGLSGRPV